MKALRFVTALTLLLFWSTSVVAQEVDLKDRPGYIDLSEIKIPVDSDEITEISLGPPLLRMITQFQENGDEELTETLEGIFSIQVKSFEVNEQQAEEMKPIIKKIEEKIYKDNWIRLIQVKKKHELTIIAMKYVENMAVGLFLMSVKPNDESTFMNIVGNINLSDLGKLNLGEYSSALDSLKFHSDKDD